MKIGYFDCFAGAAGDMIVGACLDAGASEDHLREELAKLNLPGAKLEIQSIKKSGIGATSFKPIIQKDKSHRHLPQILDIIQKAKLSSTVEENATRIFQKLAEAEAAVHATTVDKIHFHEVGAADAIIDIVGASVAMESLGIEKVYCSALVVGNGTVECEHGIMPVPAPATAHLIKGIEIRPTDIQSEMLTPTGAAILTTLSDQFGNLPSMSIEQTGYGAGQKEFGNTPNVLRLLVGQTNQTSNQDNVVVLETNLDDCSAEIIGYTIKLLINANALDVFTTPIQMKQHRPGSLLTVLAKEEDVFKMEDILFRETSTFGIRKQTCQRAILDRRHETVKTIYGDIRIKIGSKNGQILTTSPEYSDCHKAAQTHNIPLKQVYAAAMKSFNQS